MSEASSDSAPHEPVPPRGRSQRWMFLGGLAAVALVGASFLWLRSAQGAAGTNNEAGQGACCVP